MEKRWWILIVVLVLAVIGYFVGVHEGVMLGPGQEGEPKKVGGVPGAPARPIGPVVPAPTCESWATKCCVEWYFGICYSDGDCEGNWTCDNLFPGTSGICVCPEPNPGGCCCDDIDCPINMSCCNGQCCEPERCCPGFGCCQVGQECCGDITCCPSDNQCCIVNKAPGVYDVECCPPGLECTDEGCE